MITTTNSHASRIARVVICPQRRAMLRGLVEQLVDRLTATPVRNVLCMFANPDDQQPLALHHEWRAIERANDEAGRTLVLEACWATRVHDVQDILFDGPRDILHFSGHAEAGHVLFERPDGFAQPVPMDKLLGVLAGLGPRCLVFNTCESAEALAPVRGRIPHVIAMQGPTCDRAAAQFSGTFYSALARGFTIPAAFARAFEMLGLHDYAESCRPRLLH